MELYTLVTSALCTLLLPLLLLLAAVKLWDLYCYSCRDHGCQSPLPPGTMGLPFFGETLQMVLQVSAVLCGYLVDATVHCTCVGTSCEPLRF